MRTVGEGAETTYTKLTNKQESILQKVRDFARVELLPGVGDRDEHEQFVREHFNGLGELGLCAIPYPATYGGAGLDYTTYILVCEELAKVDPVLEGTLSIHTMVQHPIYNSGTEIQKMRYLGDMAKGRMLGAFALTEPGHGSDAAGIETSAKRDGSHYVVNGTKRFISNSGEADLYVVLAKTDTTKGAKGVTAFLVSPDSPGFSFGRTEHKMGFRASPTRELIFEDCRVPAENRLGEEGTGFKIFMQALDMGRVAVAAGSVGISQAAMECAIDYVKGRRKPEQQFSTLQLAQSMLADMAVKIEASRHLAYNAAHLLDEKMPCTKAASIAKVFATDAAMEITSDCLQILGDYGLTRDCPVERLMRDAKLFQIVEGTNQVQRVIIAKHLFDT